MEDKCKFVREKILNEVKNEIKELGIEPKLAIIKCNDDYASSVYVRNKIKTCESVGIKVKLFDLNPAETDYVILKNLIIKCNREFNGIILQLPLAEHLKKYETGLLNTIYPTCDIDGLTKVNKLKLIENDHEALIPCTALAVFKIMEHELGTTDFSGKRVCIVNRSELIGKPLIYLILNHNATPTICHSKTAKNINDYLYDNEHDIVITGIGNHFIKEQTMWKTLIIDCGLTRGYDNKLLRDVIRCECCFGHKNTYYGAVGTVTTACVAYNTLKAYKLQNGLD